MYALCTILEINFISLTDIHYKAFVEVPTSKQSTYVIFQMQSNVKSYVGGILSHREAVSTVGNLINVKSFNTITDFRQFNLNLHNESSNHLSREIAV